MRHVELDAVIVAVDAQAVLTQIVRFERYPTLAPHVKATEVHATLPEEVGRSQWELYFRSGLLRWSESERFLPRAPDGPRVEFVQTSGDFDEFSGSWTLRQDGPDCALHFEVDFDFGIASLEGILDPIAERVIKETIAWVVVGLFDDVRLAGHIDIPQYVSGAVDNATAP